MRTKSVKNSATRNSSGYRSLPICLTVVLALLLVPGLAFGQTFVQQAQNTAGTSSTFPAVETAGDFNVAIVGWAGAVSINPGGVTDSEGNTYVLAANTSGQSLTQAIYYAKNIKGDSGTPNTISVAFSSAPGNGTADVRVLEYTGFSSNTVTVDNWAGNSGVTSPANSGTAMTSTSSLIVGAGGAVSTFTNPPNGTGLPAGLTSLGINGFGDIAMDSTGPVAPGNYQATAGVSGGWVMQVVGFSTGGIATTAPTVTGIAPASGSTVGGTSVTITGTNFANGANALFGTAPSGISLQNCVVTTTTNPTTMSCTTPPDNAGPKDLTVVNVDGLNGSLAGAYDYSTNPPSITGISPATSTTNGGATITVTGSNFESTASVIVGGQLPRNGFALFGDNVVFNSSTSITFTTPAQPAGLLPSTLPGSPADVAVFNPTGANAGTATLPGALTYALGTGPINYIQRGDSALSSGSTANVPVPMPNPQGAGDLNVVIIGWNDVFSQVASVSDTEGNTYLPALLPTTDGVSLSQVIYYAKNIKGDTTTNNQVTVTFSRSAQTPDVRVLEYSGLDP